MVPFIELECGEERTGLVGEIMISILDMFCFRFLWYSQEEIALVVDNELLEPRREN